MAFPGRRFASASAVALLLGQSGCSLVFLKAPPEPLGDPRLPPDCSTSRVAPVLDILCAVVGFTYLGAAVAMYGEMDPSGEGTYPYIGMGVAGAALGSLCAYSASEGSTRAARCRDLVALQRRCAAGEVAACWAYVPVATPVPASPANPVPE